VAPARTAWAASAPDIRVADDRLNELLRCGRFVLIDGSADGQAGDAARTGWPDRWR